MPKLKLKHAWRYLGLSVLKVFIGIDELIFDNYFLIIIFWQAIFRRVEHTEQISRSQAEGGVFYRIVNAHSQENFCYYAEVWKNLYALVKITLNTPKS